MKLYKTQQGIVLEHENKYYVPDSEWDVLVNRDYLYRHLLNITKTAKAIEPETAKQWISDGLLPPVGRQEVWAAGVTYLRSRDARMEESETAADLYDRVYVADRPELFFKSVPERVVGHGDAVHIRRDSKWDVPEPELALFINAGGNIQAYTIGNDMSSRSIEGENALYLPQAKVYERSAALGPCLYIPENMIPLETRITMQITRKGKIMFDDSTALTQMKRSLSELAGYLFLEMEFPQGCYLMTGTCLVPSNEFTLQAGDVVDISIDGIGTLTNTVAFNRVRAQVS